MPTETEIEAAADKLSANPALRNALRPILKNGGSICIGFKPTAQVTRERQSAKAEGLLEWDGGGGWSVTPLGRKAWNTMARRQRA